MRRPSAGIAVIGLGRIGQLHARNLATCVRGARLTAVADAVEAVAHRTGDLYGVPWSASPDEVVAARNVDAIVIAAPTAHHVELVELGIRNGRAVFCEKPMGFEPGPAAAVTAAARRAGVPLQVGFQRRFDGAWIAARDVLVRGELGAVRMIRMSHRNRDLPEANPGLGDVVSDVAVHDLDAARWLAGEVADLQAEANSTTAAIALRFASGALGAVDVSRGVGYGFECAADLVGVRATVRIEASARRAGLALLRDGRMSLLLPEHHAEAQAEAYVAELEQFAATAAGQRPSGADGRDAVAALKLVAAARRSAVHDAAGARA